MALEQNVALTEDQIDVFRELINIAYGRAAGLLYDFTHVEVQLHIPEVSFFNYDGFLNDIRTEISDQMVVSQQSFHGQIAGETLMLLSQPEAKKLSQLLNHIEVVDDSDVLSAVYEVGNIITTTSTQIFSELTKVPLAFDKPITEFHSSASLMKLLEESDYNQIISISTYLDIPEKNVNAKIYYLFYRESMDLLAKSLDYGNM